MEGGAGNNGRLLFQLFLLCIYSSVSLQLSPSPFLFQPHQTERDYCFAPCCTIVQTWGSSRDENISDSAGAVKHMNLFRAGAMGYWQEVVPLHPTVSDLKYTPGVWPRGKKQKPQTNSQMSPLKQEETAVSRAVCVSSCLLKPEEGA